MAEKLMIQSIVTDNRITAQFTDKALPRYARHGELYVVAGILYIYADLDDSNKGKWFPLTYEKEIFTYETNIASNQWTIPIDFQTDNIIVIVYDQDGKVYPKDFDTNIENQIITLSFSEEVYGQAYIIINKAFDWVDRRLIVADKRFAVTENPNDVNQYFIELDTEYLEILKNGNTTFRRDVNISGTLNVDGDTTYSGNQSLGADVDIAGNLSTNGTITSINNFFAKMNATIDGNLEVKGDTTLDGNLTVLGTTTTVNTEEIKLADNIITLNSNATAATENAGIEVERGSEDNKIIIEWNETSDATHIPNNSIIDGDVLIKSNTVINGTLQVDGDTNIDGNLTISGQSGSNVDINTTSLTVEDNIVTLNKNTTGAPTENVGIEADRGDEGILPIITFNETDDNVTIPVLQQNGSFSQDEVAGKTYTLEEINKETVRATTSETTLQSNIDVETSTRETNDNTLQSNITNEETDRITADNTLTINLDNEITRAVSVDNTLRNDLTTEISDREDADTTITTNLSTETSNRTTADTTLQTNITTEATRATGVENDLQTEITAEATRAITVEGDITTLTTTDKTNLVNAINEEIDRAKTTDATLQTNIVSETTSREIADATITTNLATESTIRETVDTTIQSNLDTEITSRTTADTTIQSNLDTEVSRATTREDEIDGKFTDYVSNTQTTSQELNSDLTINENVVIKKDLTVEGITTTVNTTSIEVDDNKLILNSTVTTGAPTQDANINISRGDEGSNTIIKWYENGDSSEVQVSEWDATTSQFVERSVATKEYSDSTLQTVNTDINARIDTLESGTTASAETLTTNLDNEVTRATSTEGDLTTLTTQDTNDLVSAINSEATRVSGIETDLRTDLTTEVTRATNKDNQLQTDLTNETDRAILADSTLTTNLDNEVTRATTVEGDISTLTTVDKTDLTNAVNSLKSEIDANASTASTNVSEMFTKSGDDITFKGNLVPALDTTFNIGSPEKKIKELHVSANTIFLGDNTILSELGLQLAGSLTSTTLTTTTLVADNVYDKTAVDLNISNVETELGGAITTLQTAHNDLATIVSTDSLSKSTTEAQAVNGVVSFSTDVTVQGDLNVIGTQTTTEVVNLAIENNEIILNDGTTGTPYLDASLRVDRGDKGIQDVIVWKELGDNSSVQIPYIDDSNNIIMDEVVTAHTLTAIINATTNSSTAELDNEVTARTTGDLNLQSQINTEVSRAKDVEGVLSGLSTKLVDGNGVLPVSLVGAINKVVSNASTSESNIATSVVTETTRATNSEAVLTTNLGIETTRATTKETAIDVKIDNEITRATLSEGVLSNGLSSEKTRAQNVENTLTSDLTSEITRATNIEGGLQTSIDNIISTLSTDAERLAAIQAVTTAFEQADSDLGGSIIALAATNANEILIEQNRAESIENTLTSNLNIEINRAKVTEGILIQLKTIEQSNLVDSINEVYTNFTNETARATAAETTLTDNLATEISDRAIAIETELTARTNADATLTSNLANEITRSSDAESVLTTNLSNEMSSRISSDNTLQSNIDTEVTRAEASEQVLTNNLSNEATTRLNNDNTLQTNINDLTTEVGTFSEFETAYAANI